VWDVTWRLAEPVVKLRCVHLVSLGLSRLDGIGRDVRNDESSRHVELKMDSWHLERTLTLLDAALECTAASLRTSAIHVTRMVTRPQRVASYTLRTRLPFAHLVGAMEHLEHLECRL
jgi:hypothetical protein